MVDFGAALAALKAGGRVTRAGWNGKGMYLWLMPAATLKAEWCREPHLKAMAEANGGEIEALGTIRMYTVNAHGRRAVLTGWLASQSDMLAEDWIILED
jgi:cytochrome b